MILSCFDFIAVLASYATNIATSYNNILLRMLFKYIEQNCFSYFLSMQCINRGHLAVEAWSDCQKGMAASKPLLVDWMRRNISRSSFALCI